MKKYFFLTYIIGIFFFFSCEDNRMEGMYADKVYFVNKGKYEVSGYLSNNEIQIDIPINRSGIGNEPIDVSLEIDEAALQNYETVDGNKFQLLPNQNYALSNSSAQLEGDNRNAVVTVTIDIKKLYTIQGVGEEKFALPFKLKANGVEFSEGGDKIVIIPTLTGGIRPGSGQLLWSKQLSEMGINQTDHFTASIAVTSQYLFVNTRSADLKYYDRFTGELKGTIVLPFKGSLTNFTVANDEHDNILITNLRNAATGLANQTIYKISGTSAPVEFINLSHEFPNGRKLSIVGNLNEDALITSGVENSSKFLLWTVKQGKLVSQTPQVYQLDAAKIAWTNFGDIVPLSLDINDGYFAVGSVTRPGLGYFNVGGSMVGEIILSQLGLPSQNNNNNNSIALINFNGARYLALATQSSPSTMYASLLDVTRYQSLSKISSNSLVTYRTAPINTTNNSNYTADVQLKLAADGKSFIMYGLGTNGGITATKFTD